MLSTILPLLHSYRGSLRLLLRSYSPLLRRTIHSDAKKEELVSSHTKYKRPFTRKQHKKMSASSSASASAPLAAQLPSEPRHSSLLAYGVAVLQTAHHNEKATLTAEAANLFRAGSLPLYPPGDAAFPVPPSKPARPAHLTVVAPRDMPPAKKGVENHESNKLRLIHSLAHIESYAIDLSWDILVRFATPAAKGTKETEHVALPEAFYRDWLRIADEEAKHFTIWRTRLEELGSSYGALPVHEGLWQSADETTHSLLARLAVVHAVHEARGLDQAPRMLQQLQTYGDKHSCHLLETIEKDELTHVTSGLTWFKYLCANSPQCADLDPIKKFHAIVRANFRGSLLPPFNTKARTECGFTEEWYLPLAVKKERPAPAAAASGAVAPIEGEAAAAAAGVKVEEEKVQVAAAQ